MTQLRVAIAAASEVQASSEQPWADRPSAEATALWLKANRPAHAREVMDRARQYRSASLPDSSAR
jgi:hypothetical protein